MLVYRIQHPRDNFGPYSSMYFTKDKELKQAHPFDGITHPDPSGDPGLRCNMRHYHRSAFVSEYAMTRWFDGWMDVLKADGFRVYVFSVEDAMVSNVTGQVVYDSRKAKRKSVKDIA